MFLFDDVIMEKWELSWYQHYGTADCYDDNQRCRHWQRWHPDNSRFSVSRRGCSWFAYCLCARIVAIHSFQSLVETSVRLKHKLCMTYVHKNVHMQKFSNIICFNPLDVWGVFFFFFWTLCTEPLFVSLMYYHPLKLSFVAALVPGYSLNWHWKQSIFGTLTLSLPVTGYYKGDLRCYQQRQSLYHGNSWFE